MRRWAIWINQIWFGLSIASLFLFFALVILKSRDPLSSVGSALLATALVLLAQVVLSFPIACLAGAIATLISFVVAYFDWSLTASPVERSFRNGRVMLISTLYGLVAGGTVGFTLGYALAPDIEQNLGRTDNPLGLFAFIPFIWIPGLAMGGIWGIVNSFVLYNRGRK